MFSLSEKCPNTELFLVRILPHSDLIRIVTSYLSVFSSNEGKCGPEITPYLDTFHALSGCQIFLYITSVDSVVLQSTSY